MMRFSHFPLILTVLSVLPLAGRADDLDTIVQPGVSAVERGDAYERLTHADFFVIAPKLAKLLGTHGITSGTGPRTREPWKEEDFNEDERIGFTLSQLWNIQLSSAKSRDQYVNLMLSLLDDKSVGNGRIAAFFFLSDYIRYTSRISPSPAPPANAVLDRLEVIARNPGEESYLRRLIVALLYERRDPNSYLSLAIEVSSQYPKATDRSEAFRQMTPPDSMGGEDRLNGQNRKLFLHFAFRLLQAVNDGHGGGYFLARHVGAFLGIKDQFTPDLHLPQYQGKYGLNEGFFQTTVDNALAWQARHGDQV